MMTNARLREIRAWSATTPPGLHFRGERYGNAGHDVNDPLLHAIVYDGERVASDVRGDVMHVLCLSPDHVAELLAEVDRLRSLVEGIGSDRLKDCDGAEELARQERERVVAFLEGEGRELLDGFDLDSFATHISAEVDDVCSGRALIAAARLVREGRHVREGRAA